MNRVVAALAAAGALSAGGAAAQAGHSQGLHRAKPPAATEKAHPATAGLMGAATYTSSLSGYRPFDAAEPAKAWRQANDEVRDAGGHVGVMKALEAEKGAAPAARKQ